MLSLFSIDLMCECIVVFDIVVCLVMVLVVLFLMSVFSIFCLWGVSC